VTLRGRAPLYEKALAAYLAGDLHAWRRALKSKQLGEHEKTLLQARALLKDGELSRALETLDALPRPPNVFFEAEREMLRATALSRGGRFEAAVVANERAAEGYARADDARGLFLSNYNQSVDLSRLGLLELAERRLLEARRHRANAEEEAGVLRSLATLASQRGEHATACERMREALRLPSRAIDALGFRIVAADVFARAGRLDEAFESYRKSTVPRGDPESARARFEIQALRCLLRNEAWPARPAEIRDQKEYALKWEVLRSLEQGELREAEAAWTQLERIAPERIAAHFTLKPADEALGVFGRCLDKLAPREAPTESVEVEMTPKMKALLALFAKRNLPMRKEEIIERLWKQPYDPALDARFYKLLSRVRRLPGVKVELKHRSYRIRAGG